MQQNLKKGKNLTSNTNQGENNSKIDQKTYQITSRKLVPSNSLHKSSIELSSFLQIKELPSHVSSKKDLLKSMVQKNKQEALMLLQTSRQTKTKFNTETFRDTKTVLQYQNSMQQSLRQIKVEKKENMEKQQETDINNLVQSGKEILENVKNKQSISGFVSIKEFLQKTEKYKFKMYENLNEIIQESLDYQIQTMQMISQELQQAYSEFYLEMNQQYSQYLLKYQNLILEKFQNNEEQYALGLQRINQYQKSWENIWICEYNQQEIDKTFDQFKQQIEEIITSQKSLLKNKSYNQIDQSLEKPVVISPNSEDFKIKQIFDSFDKDNNGFLEPEEILKVSQELGKPLSADELIKVIKLIDINKDGKISFKEFNIWWKHGVKGQMEQLVYLRMKGLKLINKFGALGSLLETKYDLSKHFIGLQIGDYPPQSYFNLKLINGNDHCQINQDFMQVAKITQNSPAILLKMKVKDSKKSKLEFEKLFDTILQMFESLAPPKYSNFFQNGLKFFYNTDDKNELQILLKIAHPLLEDIEEQYANQVLKTLPPKFTQQINFSFSSANSFKDILDNAEKPVKNAQISGLSLSLEVILQKDAVARFRTEISEKMKEKSNSQFIKQIKPFMHMFLLNQSNIMLTFKSFKELQKSLGGKKLNEKQKKLLGRSLKSVLVQLKSKPQAKQILSMLLEMPIVQEIIDTFNDNCLGDLTLVTQFSGNSLVLNIDNEGLGSLLDYTMEILKS